MVCNFTVKPTPSTAWRLRMADPARKGGGDRDKRQARPGHPPRIVPVAEAMVALVLADHLLRQRADRL